MEYGNWLILIEIFGLIPTYIRAATPLLAEEEVEDGGRNPHSRDNWRRAARDGHRSLQRKQKAAFAAASYINHKIRLPHLVTEVKRKNCPQGDPALTSRESVAQR